MTSIQYHQQPIMIIGTTRHPKRILPSIHRLFQDEIHLQIPTPQQRLIIMKNLCTAFHHSVLTDEDILTLSSSAHAFIAADMARWCRLAEKNAIRSGSNTSKKKHEII
ncbi:hypothetical protein BDB01DRAFT_720223 [Pilobolus umbonatus]|nr:hypothetical protein BDB01DRAFT_720223 [Pilobolus umbonatus]